MPQNSLIQRENVRCFSHVSHHFFGCENLYIGNPIQSSRINILSLKIWDIFNNSQSSN